MPGKCLLHLAGMVEVLAFAGPVTTALSRYLSGRPVPCLANGKRWVHGNGPFWKMPLVDTGLRTVGVPRVAPLCFENTGIMREGGMAWRKK
ncbi:hypothetical protein DSM25559_2810 [Agrobacterium rosae]|uniref:Uncharacterized protein n=1 Tax=Agrobacterium rosae TaxID=1972867 RepID=A0A1R3TR17_9HYPH|nr:hypothetical protein DSM25559_2810 [Agrobacterium rosae]